MQIFVKNVSGNSMTFDVAADASVDSVKHMVEDQSFISGFRLVCAGKEIEVSVISCNSNNEIFILSSLVWKLG